VQRARIATGFEQHPEKDVDSVRRREYHQCCLAEAGDRAAHTLVGGHGTDLDGRNLDDCRAEVNELAAKGIDLVARPGDQDAAAVEWALGQRVEPLRHLDPWA